MSLPLLRVEDPDVRFNFEQIAERFLDTGGRQLKLRYGTQDLTFTASPTSATATVSHGLGSTPSVVLATANISGSAWCLCLVGNFTPTTFDLKGRDTDNTNRTGTSTAYWIALG